MGTEIPRINLDNDTPGRRVGTRLVYTLTAPVDLHSEILTGPGDELSDRMLLAGRDDIVLRLVSPATSATAPRHSLARAPSPSVSRGCRDADSPGVPRESVRGLALSSVSRTSRREPVTHG